MGREIGSNNYYYQPTYNGYDQYLSSGVYPPTAPVVDSQQQQPQQVYYPQMQPQQQQQNQAQDAPPPPYSAVGFDMREQKAQLIDYYTNLQRLFPVAGRENAEAPSNLNGRAHVQQEEDGSGNRFRLVFDILEVVLRAWSSNIESRTQHQAFHTSGIGNTTNVNHIHIHGNNVSNSSNRSTTTSTRPLSKKEQEEREAAEAEAEERRKRQAEKESNNAAAATFAVFVTGAASYALGYVSNKQMMPSDVQVGEITDFMKQSEKDGLLPAARPLTFWQKCDKYAVHVMLASGTALAVTKIAPAIFNKPEIPFCTLMAAVIFKGVYQGALEDKDPTNLEYFAGPRIRRALEMKLEYFEQKRNSYLVTMAALAALIGSGATAASSYFIPKMKRYHTVSWQGVKAVTAFIAVKWIAETAYNHFYKEPKMKKFDREFGQEVATNLAYTRSLPG